MKNLIYKLKGLLSGTHEPRLQPVPVRVRVR